MQAAYGICAEVMALKISTINGNKGYCEAVNLAAQKTKFPAFSNSDVYRDFQQPEFDMRGEWAG
jgi:colicin import membrane protein